MVHESRSRRLRRFFFSSFRLAVRVLFRVGEMRIWKKVLKDVKSLCFNECKWTGNSVHVRCQKKKLNNKISSSASPGMTWIERKQQQPSTPELESRKEHRTDKFFSFFEVKIYVDDILSYWTLKLRRFHGEFIPFIVWFILLSISFRCCFFPFYFDTTRRLVLLIFFFSVVWKMFLINLTD